MLPTRLSYLLRLGALLLSLSWLAKLSFLLYTRPEASSLSLGTVAEVLRHGFSLDLAVLGYLLALPLLLCALSYLGPELRPERLLRPYHLLLSLLLPAVYIVDTGLYPYWGFKLDATVLQYLDSPRAAAASVSLGFLLGALLLYAALVYVLWRLLERCVVSPWRRGTHPLPAALGYLLLLLPTFLVIRGGWGKSTTNVGQVYFSTDTWLNHAAVQPLFSFLSSLGKTEDFDQEYNFYPEAEQMKLLAGLYPPAAPPANTLLRLERPNVLLIVMESFGARFVGALGGDAAVSPHLDSLAREGVLFTRCYANSYRTDRGMVSTLSGYLSFPRHSVMKLPAKLGGLPSIAQSLRGAGYSTSFVYGGDANFTNTRGYLLGSGYERVIDEQDFERSAPRGNWGVHDEATMDYVYRAIQAQPQDRPWHMGLLTLSSHEPWDVPYQRLQGRERNAFAYVDAQLGRLVARLRTSPAWDRLLIICVADHGYHLADDPESRHSTAIHHIPMLWLGGALRGAARVDRLMTQSDLAATLLAQLGLSYEAFSYSRNVLASNYGYPFAYYTFNDGFGFVDSTGVSVIDNATGQALEQRPSASALREGRGRALLQQSYDDLSRR